VRLAEAFDVPDLEFANAYMNFADLQWDRHKFDQALKLRQAAYKMTVALNRPISISVASNALGRSYEQAGNYKEAEKYWRQYYEKAVDYVISAKPTSAEYISSCNFGDTAAYGLIQYFKRRGDYASIVALCDQHEQRYNKVAAMLHDRPPFTAIRDQYSKKL
jgi:tetratricopeptide (TPR) repeat protein